MKGAATKTKNFGKALKGIGLSIAITALIELAVAFYDIASGAAEARRQQDLFNDAQNTANDLATEFNKRADDKIERLKKELELRVAQGEITQKNADAQLKALQVIKEEQALGVVDKLKAQRTELEANNKELKIQADLRSQEIRNNSSLRGFEKIEQENNLRNKLTRSLRNNNDEIVKANENIKVFESIASDTNDIIHDYTVNIADNSDKLKRNTKDTDENTESKKENREEIKKLNIENALESDRRRREEKTNSDFEIENRIDPSIKIKEEQADREKEQEEKRQEALEKTSAVVEGFTDKFISDADKRIAKIDEEINKSEEQANRLQALADSGNIKAEQSLAEQNNIIAESEAEKAKLEQQKQNIELISGVILGYNSALEGGATPAEALKEAFIGTASIKGFISALPTFFDGTENTGTHGQGVDGKGGFNAILHPNERVMTSEHNNLIGDYSNNEVAKIMQQHRLGTLTQGVNIVTNNGVDNSVMESKLDSITEAIKNQPQNNIELAQITQGYMTINQTKVKGNKTTTNRFKVN